MPQTNARKPRRKPTDFPLWKHPSGRWCKKVRGRAHYFGKVADDPHGHVALERWLEVKDDLLAGRTPRENQDGLTVRDLANRFLTVKQQLVDSGDLSRHTWRNYHNTCRDVIDCFGGSRLVSDLRPSDFERLLGRLGTKFGTAARRLAVTCTRCLFKYGYESDLVDRPVKVGPVFRGPSQRVRLQQEHRNGERMFSAAEVRSLLKVADVPMKAWILLGVQAGFGNTDLARLPLDRVDLDGGWIDFPRPKTGIARRVPLWPETIAAIRSWLEQRPRPKGRDVAGLVFLSRNGNTLSPSRRDGLETDAIGRYFRRFQDAVGVYRPGRGFYGFRHTFETVAGESKDQTAVDSVMGHKTPGTGTIYRHGISDDRLLAVAEHVRRWLFGQTVDPKGSRE